MLLLLLAAVAPASAQVATARFQKHVIVLTVSCSSEPFTTVKRLEKTDQTLTLTTSDNVVATCGGDSVSFDTVKVTADSGTQGALTTVNGYPTFAATPRLHTHGEFTFTGKTSRGPEFIHPTRAWILGMDAYDDGLSNNAFDSNRPEHNDPACQVNAEFAAGNGSLKQGDCVRSNNAGNLGTKNPDGTDYLGLATYAAVVLNPAPNAGAYVGFTWMYAALYVFTVYTVTPGPSAECIDLAIDHIEVVQTVQDRSNSIPWIADKPAEARVFIRLADPSKPPVPGVGGVLHGFRGGELGDSPRSPDNIAITARAEVLRDQLDYSLNFKLPPAWTAEGRMDFQAEVKVPGCADRPDSAKITRSIGGPFQKVDHPLRIAWQPFCYQPPGGQPLCPQESLIPSYDFVLRKLYPMPPGNITLVRASLPPPPPITEVLPADDADGTNPTASAFRERFKRDLQKSYLASLTTQFDQFVGFVPDFPNIGVAGSADNPNVGGAGKVLLFAQQTQAGLTNGSPRRPENPRNATHYNAIALAHEIGHNLGRSHTNNKPTTVRLEPCGDKDIQSDWPSLTADVQEVGFDIDLGKVTPANNSELMSYCFNFEIPEWISPWTYTKLATLFGIQKVITAANQPDLSGAPPQALAAPVDQIVVSGWIRQDGTAGGLDAAYHVLSADTPPPPQDGATQCLRFSGTAGTISDYCFPLAFEDRELGQPMDRAYFALKLPVPAGTTRLGLVSANNEVAALSAGSAPPVLNIVAPQSGDRWTGGTRTISWSASDPDGKPLAYAVLYSADAGKSWLTMAMDITDSQYTFDPSQIDGGKNVMFRVLASDGLSSTSADVGPIEVVQTPGINVGSGTLDFHNQTVGQAPTQSFTIANPGSGPLTVNSFASDNAAIQVTMPKAPLVVAAGSSAAVTVEWRVAGTGAQSANLSIASNDPARPQLNLAVKGVAFASAVPNIDVSPAALDFGVLSAGQTKDLKFTIANSGGAPLTVSSIASSNARFSVVPPAPPITVAAGDSATVTARFSASTGGAASGTLTVTSNDPSRASVPVALSGTVTAPALALSPASLDFGSVTVGQTKDLTLTLTNNGTAALAVSALNVTGAVFRVVTTTAPLTVGAGASISLTLRFAPTASGQQSGSLAIVSNDPARPSASVALSGTGLGVAGGATISLSTSGLDFGAVSAGQTRDLSLTVTNTGAALLTVTAASSSNPRFSVVTPPGVFSVAAGASQAVTIRFAPTVVGAQTGTLTLSSNDTARPNVSVALSGTGTSSATEVVLQVDGSAFDSVLGYPNGAATAFFLNRLTPPSYPATLKSVQIFFFRRDNGLPVNTPITVISATNPTGSATLSLGTAGAIDLTPSSIVALDALITYGVPPRTITSGDFVVGFVVQNPAGTYPAELDQISPSQRRSYTSNDGINFQLLDSISPSVAGNLGIRAVVTLGVTGTNPVP